MGTTRTSPSFKFHLGIKELYLRLLKILPHKVLFWYSFFSSLNTTGLFIPWDTDLCLEPFPLHIIPGLSMIFQKALSVNVDSFSPSLLTKAYSLNSIALLKLFCLLACLFVCVPTIRIYIQSPVWIIFSNIHKFWSLPGSLVGAQKVFA